MSHGAVGVLLGYAVEALVGVFIGEGVQERDGAVELGLYLWLARGWERYAAQLFRRRVGVLFLGAEKSKDGKRGDEDRSKNVNLLGSTN